MAERSKKAMVYIAGPYTKPDPVENSHKAILVWKQLWDTGKITPICPHVSLMLHLVVPLPYQVWLDYDIEIMDRCDAVLRIPGESSGADKEVARARELGIPVFESVEELTSWVELFERVKSLPAARTENPEPIHGCIPSSRRERLASAALQGLLSFPGSLEGSTTKKPETTARLAVVFADALCRELDRR